MRDAKIEDEAHGLLADQALADVAVGAYGPSVEAHHFDVADGPGDEGIFGVAGHVFEGKFLVGLAVVPGVVQCGRGADGLLKGAAGPGIRVGEVIAGSAVLRVNTIVASGCGSEAQLLMVLLTSPCIRSLDATKCRKEPPALSVSTMAFRSLHGRLYLIRLRGDSDTKTGPVGRDLHDVNLRRSTALSRSRMVRAITSARR